jgi:hypothetical protein
MKIIPLFLRLLGPFFSLVWQANYEHQGKEFLVEFLVFYRKKISTEKSLDKVMTRLQAKRSGFRIPVGAREFFFFSEKSRPALNSISLPLV